MALEFALGQEAWQEVKLLPEGPAWGRLASGLQQLGRSGTVSACALDQEGL